MNNKKRFLITLTTNWVGHDKTLAYYADDVTCFDDNFLYCLASENLLNYIDDYDLALREGVNVDSQEDYENFLENLDYSDYCQASVEEFNGTDEEWDEYDHEYYG